MIKDSYCPKLKLFQQEKLNILEQIKHFNRKRFCICENEALNKTKSKQTIY